MWLTLPWTLLIVDGLSKIRSWKWRGTEPLDKLRVFTAAWLLLPLAFFSFSGSKLAGYILPVLPAMALIGGVQLTRFNLRAPGKSLAMRATGALVILIDSPAAVLAFQAGYFSTRVALVVYNSVGDRWFDCSLSHGKTNSCLPGCHFCSSAFPSIGSKHRIW